MELITAFKEGAAIPDARGEVVTEVVRYQIDPNHL